MSDVNLTSKIKMSVQRWLSQLTDEGTGEVPEEGNPQVSNTVIALFRESVQYRQGAFTDRLPQDETPHDPIEVWKNFRKLEQSRHWEVYGRRNQEAGREHQHELVDDEIGNQIRVRKSYLTANWHNVTVFPNISHINEILDQERAATEWSDVITQGVHKGLTEGHAVFMSIFDKSTNPDGLAREIICDNASIFPTPNSTSFQKVDGCWYVIYATVEQRRFILEEYPHLKDRLLQIDKDRAAQISMEPNMRNSFTYAYNGTVDKLVCWCDDETLESIPFTEDEVHQEHGSIHQGQPATVTKEQNHRKHIDMHLNWLDEVNANLPPEDRTPEEAEFLDRITEVILMHVQEHVQTAEKKLKSDGIPVGKRRKYPFGRRIVVVGSETAEDVPSPYNFDWRKLFHKWDVEKLPESFYGRGTAEILYSTNRTLDTMASRIADISLSVGTPKPWLPVSDKNLLAEGDLNNDPQEPSYYGSQPPVFPKGESPRENLEIYQMMKQNAARQQGVNPISYGNSPNAQASGDLVEILLKQNSVLITGEANQRLNGVIESMVETRIMMWKQFYTEPRYYYINGQWRAMTLRDILSTYPVVDEQGQVKQQDIPMFQVRVKQGSNVANQWELDLAFAIQLYGLKRPDGMPVIPPEAVLDIVSARYPQYGRQGNYYQISEATRMGMQIMEQEQARKREDIRTIKRVRENFKARGIKELLGQGEQEQPKPSNGAS